MAPYKGCYRRASRRLSEASQRLVMAIGPIRMDYRSGPP